jgi:hypothetical protein
MQLWENFPKAGRENNVPLVGSMNPTKIVWLKHKGEYIKVRYGPPPIDDLADLREKVVEKFHLKNVRSSQVTVELSDGTQLLKEDEGWPDDQGTTKETALNVVYEEKVEGPQHALLTP